MYLWEPFEQRQKLEVERRAVHCLPDDSASAHVRRQTLTGHQEEDNTVDGRLGGGEVYHAGAGHRAHHGCQSHSQAGGHNGRAEGQGLPPGRCFAETSEVLSGT
jgi:hypothetical protein